MPGPIECWSSAVASLEGTTGTDEAADGSEEVVASTVVVSEMAEALSLSFSLALAARMRVLKTAGLDSSRTT
jgi:hypothetical protein